MLVSELLMIVLKRSIPNFKSSIHDLKEPFKVYVPHVESLWELIGEFYCRNGIIIEELNWGIWIAILAFAICQMLHAEQQFLQFRYPNREMEAPWFD
jgi:hypothetical protein